MYPGGNAPGQFQFILTGQLGEQRYFRNNFYRLCDNQYVYNGVSPISEKDGYVEGSFIGKAYPLFNLDCEDQKLQQWSSYSKSNGVVEKYKSDK